MPTTGTSCRRGTSTILGTIIFVGIIFSAFIPMMLVMRQADTLHDMRKYELGILDQERMDEAVYVYVFPVSESSDDLTLRIVNRGDFVVKIVKIWINDNSYSEEYFNDFIVEPMGMDEEILDESYFIPETGKNYFIKITTDKGNIFSSYSGSIIYGSGGTWEEGIFAINVLISYPESGWYYININHDDENGLSLEGSPFPIHKSSSGPAFGFFKITTKDTYYVKITKNSVLIHDEYVTLDWPEYPPVVWIFA